MARTLLKQTKETQEAPPTCSLHLLGHIPKPPWWPCSRWYSEKCLLLYPGASLCTCFSLLPQGWCTTPHILHKLHHPSQKDFCYPICKQRLETFQRSSQNSFGFPERQTDLTTSPFYQTHLCPVLACWLDPIWVNLCLRRDSAAVQLCRFSLAIWKNSQ